MTELEPPNFNTDTPWNEMDDLDICRGVEHGRSLEEAADFLWPHARGNPHADA
jgi:hypothetical protein